MNYPGFCLKRYFRLLYPPIASAKIWYKCKITKKILNMFHPYFLSQSSPIQDEISILRFQPRNRYFTFVHSPKTSAWDRTRCRLSFWTKLKLINTHLSQRVTNLRPSGSISICHCRCLLTQMARQWKCLMTQMAINMESSEIGGYVWSQFWS